MVYKKETFIAYVKKAIADRKSEKAPAGGANCAIASLRYMRDGLIDDIYGVKPGEQGNADDAGAIAAIRESFKEIIDSTHKEGADSGFASNASAAAKAAGFKATTASNVAELLE